MRYSEAEYFEELDLEDAEFMLHEEYLSTLNYQEMYANGEISREEFDEFRANTRDVELAIEYSCYL